jgi:hypothetical protein
MKSTLFLTTLFLAATTSATAAVIINETWTDGERATQDLPNNSMAWFTSASSSTLTATTGAMTQVTGTSGRHALGYFTDFGSPVSLAIGERITVSFVVVFNRATALGTTDNGFKVGLYDGSTGTRVAIDSHGGTSASTTFDNYFGYAAMTNIGLADGNKASIRERTSVINQAFIGSTTPYTTLGNNGGPAQLFEPGVEYGGLFSIERVDDALLSLTFTMSGGAIADYTITRTDETPSAIAFDTVAFHMNSNQADSFTLKQVEISIVPEPAHFALLLGALGLLGVLIRRRLRC